MSATRTKQTRAKSATARASGQPREGSVMWAAIRVLDGKRKPMSPSEILTEIQQRKLASGLNGKTPEATVAARLAVHAKQGRYVERPEKGKYQLIKNIGAKPAAKRARRAKAGARERGARQDDGPATTANASARATGANDRAAEQSAASTTATDAAVPSAA